MNNPPLISVIIPAYNAEEYIAQCIENLLFQSYKNLEIVVVDDGSTDGTKEIVAQFSSVKYIYQSNNGVSSARNRGIEEALGDFVHFMDADDLISLDFYEKMLQAMLETRADMACCGFVFERFLSQSQTIGNQLLLSKTNDKVLMTNVCNYGACWRYLIRKSLITDRNIQFETTIIVGEDRLFSIQCVFWAKKIVLVPGIIYYYKNRTTSVTTTRDLNTIQQRHRDRKIADKMIRDFANQHRFELEKGLYEQRWQYKFLGIPLLSEKRINKGKSNWYLLGFIPVFQKKEIDK